MLTMGPRPLHLKLGSDDLSQPPPPPPKAPFYMDLPSPRAGEKPPALSPLDALAMHSRLLTKKFERPENGRRISRLPHTEVAKELGSRPDYFRSVSDGSEGGMSDVPELREDSSPTGQNHNGMLLSNIAEKDRPMSHYPMFGNAANRDSELPIETPFFDAQEELPKSTPHNGPRDYFGVSVPRALSPEPVDPRMVNVQAASPMQMPSLTNSVDSVQSMQPRTLTNSSTRSQRSLAPPRSPAYPKSPRSMQSIRSVPPDSGDEEASLNGSRAVSSSRKFSGSSGMSRPQSPFSPWQHPMHRSPSMTSEFSMNGSLRRTNFSRPLSSGSNRQQPEPRPSFDSRSSFETRPSTDLPHRHPSAASGSTQPSSGMPSRQASQDEAAFPFDNGTPRAVEQSNDDQFHDRPTTSYTYRKYTLPRGKTVERTSRGTRDSWIQSQFTWDNETPKEAEGKELPEPPKPEQLAQPARVERTVSDAAVFQAPPARSASPATSERIPQDRQTRLGRNRAMSSATRSRSAEPRTVQKAAALHKSTPSVKTHDTSSSGRTVTPATTHERSGSTELTAEEHLEIGIQTHSNGELSKSTYHLRIAAREGSPTGMLLYALACRHGWGMRPNQEEGVRWLKKAVDTSGLEVADVEQTLSAASKTPKSDPVAEAQERRKRKAQFALAIYELGISYMNGWGCTKDKPLAVRCYEVAGSWGDCDALAEAGYCYTEGVGCKKDLKKAAALYRQAADGGMSMAGNSW